MQFTEPIFAFAKVTLYTCLVTILAISSSSFFSASAIYAQSELNAAQATLVVCQGDGDYQTVQAAIDAATAGDTISICAGAYTESLSVDKDLILRGADATSTIVSADNTTTLLIAGGANVLVENLTLTNVEYLQDRAGIGVENNGAVTLNNVIVEKNLQGIVNQSGTVVINDSIVRENGFVFPIGNVQSFQGGGIRNLDQLQVNNSTIVNNVASDGSGEFGFRGGGLYNAGVATVSSTIIEGNRADSGGGIYNSFRGDITVTGSTIRGHVRITEGGGLENDGTMRIEQTSITDNEIIGNSFSESCRGGAAIANYSELTVADSLISGNVARYSFGFTGDPLPERCDGAIRNRFDATALIVNSTLSGNAVSCDESFGCTGGAVTNEEGAQIRMESVTIYENEGGGIYNDEFSTMELSNSIVANSLSDTDCANGTAVTSLGHNIGSDRSCNLRARNDLTRIDPLLGALQDNGGPTLTHAPLLGSPVIDAANSATCPSTDQRGVARPQGDGCDIGAVEIEQATPPPPVCGPLSQEGEDGVLTGDFVVGTDSAASGGQFVHVPTGTGSQKEPNDTQKAEYCFIVDEEGDYVITGTVYAESKRDNSFFVQVEGEPTKGIRWNIPATGAYVEDTVSVGNKREAYTLSLMPGEYVVTIFLREDGARLDTIALEPLVSTANVVERSVSTQMADTSLYLPLLFK